MVDFNASIDYVPQEDEYNGSEAPSDAPSYFEPSENMKQRRVVFNFSFEEDPNASPMAARGEMDFQNLGQSPPAVSAFNTEI